MLFHLYLVSSQSDHNWARHEQIVTQGRFHDFLQGGVQLTHARRRLAAAGGMGPQKMFKARCFEMRFQANPDGKILAQNDIELLCEARGNFEIGD
jgi:hypothetical protein